MAPEASGNIFDGLPGSPGPEHCLALIARPGLDIERIVSHGHASPDGFWYDQPRAEWVIVLSGAARLRFEDEAAARMLSAGDWVDIAPHRRHRVEWTDPDAPTVWLAVHYG